MFISLVTETFYPDINGVATTLSQLHAALVAAGHRVQVVCPRTATPRIALKSPSHAGCRPVLIQHGPQHIVIGLGAVE